MKVDKKTLMKEIAFALQMYSDNVSYYLKLDTFEIAFSVDPCFDNDPDIQMKNKEIEKNPDNYIKIEPFKSFDAFTLMERFAESVEDNRLQSKLYKAFSARKPFENFKTILNYHLDYREKWYKFKDEFYANAASEWLKTHKISFD